MNLLQVVRFGHLPLNDTNLTMIYGIPRSASFPSDIDIAPVSRLPIDGHCHARGRNGGDIVGVVANVNTPLKRYVESLSGFDKCVRMRFVAGYVVVSDEHGELQGVESKKPFSVSTRRLRHYSELHVGESFESGDKGERSGRKLGLREAGIYLGPVFALAK